MSDADEAAADRAWEQGDRDLVPVAQIVGRLMGEDDAPERLAAATAYETEHLTLGSFASEAESARALDEAIEAIGLFRIHREVVGSYLFMRPEAALQTARIDRILIPTPALLEQGWNHGPVGIECKRSGVKLGPPLAQLLDYSRATWQIGATWIMPRFYFLWPMAKAHGPLASVLAQNRVGSAFGSRYQRLHLACGEQTIARFARDGGVDCSGNGFGRKTGSR